MDNTSLAKRDYEDGWRAYRHEDHLFFLIPEGTGVRHSATDRESIKEWHALRAYQDDQRKKGVPINIYYGNGGKEWLDLSTPEYRFVYTVNGGRPSIEVPVPSVLVGGLQAHQKVFTNFRWKEGYPKGKIRMGPDKLEISNVTVINPIKPGWGQEIRDKSGIQLKLVDGEWINVYGQE